MPNEDNSDDEISLDPEQKQAAFDETMASAIDLENQAPNLLPTARAPVVAPTAQVIRPPTRTATTPQPNIDMASINAKAGLAAVQKHHALLAQKVEPGIALRTAMQYKQMVIQQEIDRAKREAQTLAERQQNTRSLQDYRDRMARVAEEKLKRPEYQTVVETTPPTKATEAIPGDPGSKGIFGIGARPAVPEVPAMPAKPGVRITRKVPVGQSPVVQAPKTTREFPSVPTDVKERVKGQTYKSPKGNFTWTGTGWIKAD